MTTNVERLVQAGVLDNSELTTSGESAINNIDLTEQEIDALVSIKEKLALEPLLLKEPGQGIGIWRL